MKKRTKTIIILSCLCGAVLALGLGACAGSETRENNIASLAKKGKNVIVYYEKNGGIFSAGENVEMYDALSFEQLQGNGAKLLAPGDPRRDSGSGGNNATTSTATRSGYTLIGWYRSREDRKNENGDLLDDEGNICYIPRVATTEEGETVLDEEGNPLIEYVSDAGKPQSYTYSGRWDFDNDHLTTEDVEPEEVGKKTTVYAIHLYAAWAPNFVYEFYEKVGDEENWQAYGTTVKPVSLNGIDVPQWDDEKGSINYDNVPRYAIAGDEEKGVVGKNFTLTGIYADPECTQPYAIYDETEAGGKIYEKTMVHPGITDVDSGTSTETTVKIYTKWKEGDWFRIRTARQLADNTQADGHYSILADLDFSADTWSFSGLTFTGSFDGNYHTISNITASQTDSTQTTYGGLFGTFTSEALLEDITFENVRFTVAAGVSHDRSAPDRVVGHFGLLAGILEEADETHEGVTEKNFQGVTLKGTILVGGQNIITTCLGTTTAPAGAQLTSFALGIIAGNVFGKEAMDALGIDYEEEGRVTVTAESAIYPYDYDDNYNSIYGTQLAVEANTDETSEEYGRVTATVLKDAITIL